MNRLDSIWACDHEILVAALKHLTAEIGCGQLHLLERGACGTVKDQNRTTGIVKSAQEAGGFGDGLCLDCLHHR